MARVRIPPYTWQAALITLEMLEDCVGNGTAIKLDQLTRDYRRMTDDGRRMFS